MSEAEDKETEAETYYQPCTKREDGDFVASAWGLWEAEERDRG